MMDSVLYSDSNLFDVPNMSKGFLNGLAQYGAIVAGGCLRDNILFGKEEYKDIDVFMDAAYYQNAIEYGNKNGLVPLRAGSHLPAGSHFTTVKMGNPKGPDYDFVFIENMDSVVDNFDVSVNKIWAELPSGKIYMKEDAAQYMEDGSVFIYPANCTGSLRKRVKTSAGIHGTEYYVCYSKFGNTHSYKLHSSIKKEHALEAGVPAVIEAYSDDNPRWADNPVEEVAEEVFRQMDGAVMRNTQQVNVNRQDVRVDWGARRQFFAEMNNIEVVAWDNLEDGRP